MKNVTILVQRRHGLRNTQEMSTNTNEDDNQDRKPHQEDELKVNEGERECDDGGDTIEGLKGENID